MQTADDHKKEERLKSLLKEYPLDRPDPGFTDRFMARLENEVVRTPSSHYTPLISIRSGAVVAVICIALIIAATKMEMPQSLFSFRLFDLISIEWDAWNQVTERIGTSVALYATIVLMVGMGIQVYFLKRWHSRQLFTS